MPILRPDLAEHVSPYEYVYTTHLPNGIRISIAGKMDREQDIMWLAEWIEKMPARPGTWEYDYEKELGDDGDPGCIGPLFGLLLVLACMLGGLLLSLWWIGLI